MNRRELVQKLAAENGVPSAVASKLLGSALEIIQDALGRGERVLLSGFGSFEVKRRAPRVARNPRSGETIKVPEKKVAVFRPGGGLKLSHQPARQQRATGPGRQLCLFLE